MTTLRGHRDQLGRLAHALLEGETLDEDDAYAAAGIDRSTAPAAVDAAVARGEAASTMPAPDSPASWPRACRELTAGPRTGAPAREATCGYPSARVMPPAS